MKILGIETSCDETAVALLTVNNKQLTVNSNVILSQIKIHQQYGGVVPEVAAREHEKSMIPVVAECLKEAKIKPIEIDYIAVTYGPGLITSLMVGVETAKVLSYLWKKPLIAVNHVQAHINANWLTSSDKQLATSDMAKKIQFPALCLIVSGGHTQLVILKNINSYQTIGQTLDDAAGEAFDKVAKILDIGYPGGPIIEKLGKTGNPQAILFPRPMLKSDDFNFSFSGLKTAVLYFVQNQTTKQPNNQTPNICASFEQAVVDVLISKTIRAAKQYKVKTVMLGGGVAANQRLRNELRVKSEELGFNFSCPAFEFCADNAAMVAMAGYFLALKKKFTPWDKIKVNPNLEL